jgi:hypothetical protein
MSGPQAKSTNSKREDMPSIETFGVVVNVGTCVYVPYCALTYA